MEIKNKLKSIESKRKLMFITLSITLTIRMFYNGFNYVDSVEKGNRLNEKIRHYSEVGYKTNLYKEQEKKLSYDFNKVLKKTLDENKKTEIVQKIFKIAMDNNLSIKTFTSLLEKKHEFYIEIPITMTVTANYHQLASFLSKVAEMPYLITFDELLISKLTSLKDEKIPSDLLSMKVKIKIYSNVL
ncbi:MULTISPECIES: type 4a pilus biogenesis protein PilO [unclassified Legionella]|uniref:type 4a pilus biogenesis protein PilO n=1 Tax=unclassified Legionella TaxID=2622702 RepID=UPI0010550D20|nr:MULTISPECIES: type 4a pilus biogenesis protein PilO [unclassified Legionella]MDI9817712.1 type 4a pilus biogenesis protein PilO [Legionella sp. PL877]